MSRQCCGTARYTPKHFWSHASRRRNGCWEWNRSLNGGGYGNVGHGRAAHRVAYQLAHGPLPPDKPLVCHRCNNPACIRPTHLYAGDRADNMRDYLQSQRR